MTSLFFSEFFPAAVDAGDRSRPPAQLRPVLLALSACLSQSGVDSPRLCAELIVGASLGWDRNRVLKELLLAPEMILSPPALVSIRKMALRRAGGEPMAYILGSREFYSRNFLVSPDTLVPRPETELLVDLALQKAAKTPAPGWFADFGAGSGSIAVTVALHLPNWRGIGLEKSRAALAVAEKNRALHSGKNLTLVQGDFSRPPFADRKFQLLLSNPPYVSEEEYKNLSPEVREFEPRSALVPQIGAKACRAGLSIASGLEGPVMIIHQAGRLLQSGGWLLLEMGCTQGQTLLQELAGPLWSDACIHKDLAGLDRVLAARRT